MLERIKDNYGYLFENELLDEISRVGSFREVAEGTIFIEPGQYIKGMPLLLDGAIKISRVDENGDELLLYFIERGDTCAMTLNCCVHDAKSSIKAVADTDTSLILIPVNKMDEWLVQFKSWRNFILNSYQMRLNEVLETVDTIAFLKMDERLLKYLQDKTKITHDTHLHITHEEIAKDLHTSRVVISRLLKKMEQQGDVKLGRNSLEVINI